MATSSAVNNSPQSTLFSSLNGTQSSSSSSANSMTDVQSRFLTLLTTQLKNQDPLNPMDNAQMTSQLAQINMVDGIDKLNTTLSKLIDGQSQSQALQAAALVGHGVLVPGTNMDLTSGAAVAGFELSSGADAVNVDIKDANGLVVRTLRLGAQKAGIQAFGWDGKTEAGTQAADGHYSFAISATQGSEKVKVSGLGYGVVESVTQGSQGLSANVGGYGAVDIGEVKQIL